LGKVGNRSYGRKLLGIDGRELLGIDGSCWVLMGGSCWVGSVVFGLVLVEVVSVEKEAI
jgi:hypothetical protein